MSITLPLNDGRPTPVPGLRALAVGGVRIDVPVYLAPMSGVTDLPFRRLARAQGTGMVVSEMIASQAMVRENRQTLKMAEVDGFGAPSAVQLAGCEPGVMAEAARLAADRGAAIIDINFGCPVKKVVTKGAGAAVLKDIDLMTRLTKAVVRSTSLPVTVKTRLGWDFDSINIVEVAERLQDVGIQALSIHGRTRSQLYKGEADWSWIAKVKENPRIQIPIFGNGDIDSPEKALEYKNRYGIDGIMIGRAAIGYPWIFNEIKYYFATGAHLDPPNIEQRVEVIRTHLVRSVEWKGHKPGINEMRRHYAHYLKGLPNIKEYRQQLVTLNTVEEIELVLQKMIANYSGFVFERQKTDLSGLAYACDS